MCYHIEIFFQIKILFTSVGRRVELMQAFRSAADRLGVPDPLLRLHALHPREGHPHRLRDGQHQRRHGRRHRRLHQRLSEDEIAGSNGERRVTSPPYNEY